MKSIHFLMPIILLLPVSTQAGEETDTTRTLQERKQNISDEQLREFMEKKKEYRDNPEAMKFIEAVEKELGITEEDLERAQAGAGQSAGDGNSRPQRQPAPVEGNARVAEEAYRSGDYETARQHYESLAAQGDGYASLILGLMYQQGQGVDADTARAHAYYKQAAEHGDDRGSELIDTLEHEMSEEQISKAAADYESLVETREKRKTAPAGQDGDARN